MSRPPQQRIDDALSQLVGRILPAVEEDDDTSADDLFYQAFDRARAALESAGQPSIVKDENHVADLIKRKLVRDYDTPDKALQFSNLFSRLLSRPVLNQKWGILYLLHQLSDSVPAPSPPSVLQRRASQPSAALPTRQSLPRQSSHALVNHRESDMYDEAFSRPGLSTMPSPTRPEGAHQNGHGHRVSKSVDSAPPRRPRDFLQGESGPERDESPISPAVKRTPTEANLLREIPFTLQGVSSADLLFLTPTTLKLPQSLPAPLIALLHALAEPSLLYKGLSAFVDSSNGGLIGQSLRAAIGLELRSYLSLIATLEGQIRQALAKFDESAGKVGLGKAGVTLKRCVVWTREATMGLRLMSLIVDESQSKKGGQLITLIHSLASSHGDPFVGAFAERLLSQVTRPFYDMLRSWIYDGELKDPYLEFFVSEHSGRDDNEGRGAATSVWEDKYKLDDVMIPSIITEEFARKVFLIGKSLNFIRYGCGDSAWVDDYSKNASRELRYGDTATLYGSIDMAYKTTMARLTWLMNDKFKLVEHLTALKKYLLLGQGDFIALLMESLAMNLDRPANSQYRHTLTAQLEHAIRNSNAQYDSVEVLRRLDARMLELSMGEIGWDVFTLEYKVDAPVDVIVTPHNNIQYLKVFNFLWRVKRVEFALGVTWRRCMTGARGVLSAVETSKPEAGVANLAEDWKVARCSIAEMIHFVNQLQYYILFEVIESSWDALMRDMAKPEATLDDLISAHTRYLRSITRKGLLGSGSHSSTSSSSSHGGSANFTSQLHELLKVMLAYKEAVDGLYALSISESTRLQEKEARIESRTRGGKWGITERDEEDSFREQYARGARDDDGAMPPPLLHIGTGGELNIDGEGATGLPALRKRLASLTLDFRARITGLLGDLAYQPDPDMRFLAVVMNFNEVYKVVRRSRRAADSRRDASGRGARDKRERDKGPDDKGDKAAAASDADADKRRSRHGDAAPAAGRS